MLHITNRAFIDLTNQLTNWQGAGQLHHTIANYLKDITEEEIAASHPVELVGEQKKRFNPGINCKIGPHKAEVLGIYRETNFLQHDLHAALATLKGAGISHNGELYVPEAAWDQFTARVQDLAPQVKALDERVTQFYERASREGIFHKIGAHRSLIDFSDYQGGLAHDMRQTQGYIANLQQPPKMTKPVYRTMKDIIPDVGQRIDKKSGWKGKKHTQINLAGLDETQRHHLSEHVRSAFGGVTQVEGDIMTVSNTPAATVSGHVASYKSVMIHPEHGHVPLHTPTAAPPPFWEEPPATHASGAHPAEPPVIRANEPPVITPPVVAPPVATPPSEPPSITVRRRDPSASQPPIPEASASRGAQPPAVPPPAVTIPPAPPAGRSASPAAPPLLPHGGEPPRVPPSVPTPHVPAAGGKWGKWIAAAGVVLAGLVVTASVMARKSKAAPEEKPQPKSDGLNEVVATVAAPENPALAAILTQEEKPWAKRTQQAEPGAELQR